MMKSIFGILGLLAVAGGMQTSTISFSVNVGTSGIAAATPGYIEFQFNQANTGALSGTAAITGYTSSGFTFDNSTNGATAGVNGTLLGGNLVMPNDVGGVNYSDQGATSWGSGFSFVVTFSGPLVGGTGGTDPSGFYVLLYDSGFGPLGSTFSQGEAANLIFNTDGTTIANTVRGSSVIGTPEPGSLVLGGI